MIASSPRQLKDWISNMAKKNNISANIVLQNFMLERFLERISLSRYKDKFILKGGLLIAAMVGIDIRSTMDMDTTIKGITINKEKIEEILSEIIAIDIEDGVIFSMENIKSIHDISEYEDFRVSLVATFQTIKVNIKIDITTGDIIIPKEINYSFKLMFQERSIDVLAYNLNTILAEKIESILVRNIANTRARDFYDVYILLTTGKFDIDIVQLREAIKQKSIERNSIEFINNNKEYVDQIRNSDDIIKIWNRYQKSYSYAKDIEFNVIIDLITDVLKCLNKRKVSQND